jgi:hypothetical protein
MENYELADNVVKKLLNCQYLIATQKNQDLDLRQYLKKLDPCDIADDSMGLIYLKIANSIITKLPDRHSFISIQLTNNFDINYCPENLPPILHIAAYYNDIVITKLIMTYVIDGNINRYDSEHQTALHIGCILNNEFIVRILCESGADVNIENASLYTPLEIACMCVPSISYMLINNGANIYTKDYTETLVDIIMEDTNFSSDKIERSTKILHNIILFYTKPLTDGQAKNIIHIMFYYYCHPKIDSDIGIIMDIIVMICKRKLYDINNEIVFQDKINKTREISLSTFCLCNNELISYMIDQESDCDIYKIYNDEPYHIIKNICLYRSDKVVKKMINKIIDDKCDFVLNYVIYVILENNDYYDNNIGTKFRPYKMIYDIIKLIYSRNCKINIEYTIIGRKECMIEFIIKSEELSMWLLKNMTYIFVPNKPYLNLCVLHGIHRTIRHFANIDKTNYDMIFDVDIDSTNYRLPILKFIYNAIINRRWNCLREFFSIDFVIEYINNLSQSDRCILASVILQEGFTNDDIMIFLIGDVYTKYNLKSQPDTILLDSFLKRHIDNYKNDRISLMTKTEHIFGLLSRYHKVKNEKDLLQLHKKFKQNTVNNDLLLLIMYMYFNDDEIKILVKYISIITSNIYTKLNISVAKNNSILDKLKKILIIIQNLQKEKICSFYENGDKYILKVNHKIKKLIKYNQ